MASKTYQCYNCGYEFPCSEKPTGCPICKSTNIKQLGGSKKWIYIISVLIIIIAVVLVLFKQCIGIDTFNAKLISDSENVTIKVSGVSSETLENYKVQVMQGTDEVNLCNFSGNSAIWSLQHALAGRCYDFRIIDQNGKPANVQWDDNNNRYCHPEDTTEPNTPLSIASIMYTADPDYKSRTYKVTITLSDGSNADEYAIDGKWQKNNIFNGIKDGTHKLEARLAKDKKDQDITLQIIPPQPPKPLGKTDINNIFNSVTNGNLSQGGAQNKLAAGNVNLKKAIKMAGGNTLTTLTDVLQEAEEGSRFEVINFQLDPKTNKIKSGTLEIAIKYDNTK